MCFALAGAPDAYVSAGVAYFVFVSPLFLKHYRKAACCASAVFEQAARTQEARVFHFFFEDIDRSCLLDRAAAVFKKAARTQ